MLSVQKNFKQEQGIRMTKKRCPLLTFTITIHRVCLGILFVMHEYRHLKSVLLVSTWRMFRFALPIWSFWREIYNRTQDQLKILVLFARGVVTKPRKPFNVIYAINGFTPSVLA